MRTNPQIKFRWKTIDGYHEYHQMIDDTGRIVGVVSGSRFNLGEGWTALDEIANKHLGRYETTEQAKTATVKSVMNHCAGARGASKAARSALLRTQERIESGALKITSS